VTNYAGHDELSTVYGFHGPFPMDNPSAYSGRFMADDFADKLNSPVVHIKWWGSYLADHVAEPLNRFLIAFESDQPVDAANSFSHPAQPLLTQIVNRATTLTPGSGTFTEKLVRGPDPVRHESLYEYNAELHFNSAFFEQKNTVYWLKIAALVDVTNGTTFPVNAPPPTMTQWGWHNRDYTIQDTLASQLVAPGEQIVGPVDGASVWHFQDDAVTGTLRYTNVLGTPNFGIFQPVQNMSPTNYLANGIDGPSATMPGTVGIDFYSKDLAFNLYTNNPQMPEPAACLLLVSGALGLTSVHRRRRG
jgi:hypothetical protein